MQDNLTQIEFIELGAAGKTYKMIATELRVWRKTLYVWSKKYFSSHFSPPGNYPFLPNFYTLF